MDVDTGRKFTNTPFPKKFSLLGRMTRSEVQDARTAIEEMIDASIGVNEIHTAGWMPGSDWTGTRFQPIFEKAAGGNFDLAAKIFGLLVFEVFRECPETWWTGRFELDGREIGSRTYFIPRAN